MKEIISVKKDIIFKTKISEITSLNLEHDYKINEDLVEGKLVLSGAYKMTEASLMEEEFFYTIPFSIAISDNIKRDTIHIEIDDFKYDIHKDIMKINVELELECEENITDEVEEIINEELNIQNNDIETINNLNQIIEEEIEMEDNDIYTEFNQNTDIIKNNLESILEENNLEEPTLQLPKIEKEVTIEESENVTNNETINNLANSLNTNEENYHTYKVYIVRNGDTIETICSKYNLLIDDLKEYNDINNVNIGDKIIIPQIINE